MLLINKIKELNDILYAAFGELHENQSHLCGKENEVAAKIMELYELDYKLIKGELMDEDFKVHELERRKKIMTPRKRKGLFFWKKNDAEYLLDREAALRAKEFFDHKEWALEELERILEEAEKASTAEGLEEPKPDAAGVPLNALKEKEEKNETPRDLSNKP